MTSAPWQLLALIAALSAIGALVGGVAAFVGVSRRRQTDHEDIVCLRMKRVFETSFEGKIIVNRDMVIVAANRQARAITGYGSELVGRSIYDIIPQRFHEVHRKHVQRYINDPHPRKMGTLAMELWLVDRFNTEKKMLLSLSPSEDSYGGIEITVGFQVVQE